MSLARTAQETLEVIGRGAYAAPSGKEVTLRAPLEAAVRGTVVYRPEDLDGLLVALPSLGSASAQIEVTTETTAQAGRRLAQAEQVARVAALNFASAKNPGGGFLTGAKAQEEDLARCSGLYACLREQQAYYDANRRTESLLYTDHIIYSPDVPFFRDERLRFLEDPFLLSVITAPAPNAGAALARDPTLDAHIREVLAARARKVLAVAAAQRHRCLVLGAWGCGVFRNDAGQVASAFAQALVDERLRGAFDRVVFAVYDPGGRNLRAFERQFGSARLL
jgi:uncharacterized protein (TIGR02452 family)